MQQRGFDACEKNGGTGFDGTGPTGRDENASELSGMAWDGVGM